MLDHCNDICYYRAGCYIRAHTKYIKKLFGVIDCPCYNCIVKVMCHKECDARKKKVFNMINGYERST
jgi:hypothetical protein